MTHIHKANLNGLSPEAPCGALAVLSSAGLDSSILLAEALAERATVHPLYVRQGLAWEATELKFLRQYLQLVQAPNLAPLQILELPMGDLYGDHWSIVGGAVPDADSPDEAVFLPGRNVILLAKAILWCHLHRVAAVALAPLASNPFPDATPEFFTAMASAVNMAVRGNVKVLLPYAGLSKVEVMHRGRHLPLHATFSCIQPLGDRHCGRCNKCGERQRAFAEASMDDPTDYVVSTTKNSKYAKAREGL